MSDKLAKKLKENQGVAEAEINRAVSQSHKMSAIEKQLIRIGMVAGVGRIAQTLSAQTIKGLQKIRDDHDYESIGFTRFDDFLNQSELSPMSYRQFNEREKLLESEGDEVFDLMNTLRISHSQRKLLGAGNVQLDGDLVIITSGGKEESIDISDRTRLVQTLSALADQNAIQSAKIEKGSKQVEDLTRKVDELKNRPGQVSIESLYFESYMRVAASIQSMIEIVKKLPKEKRDEHAELYCRSISGDFLRLADACGLKNYSIVDSAGSTPETDGEFSNVLSKFSDDDEED